MRFDRRVLLKVSILLLLLVAAALLLKSSWLRGHLAGDSLRDLVEQFGIFSFLIYIIITAVAVTLLVPGTIFALAGGYIFGVWLGTLLTVAGTTLGAALSFLLARSLGRDFFRSIIGDRLAKYDALLEEHGLLAILCLRLAFFPLMALNYGAGLTRVRFRDFLIATFIGLIPSTLAVTLIVNRITRVRSWTGMLSWDVLLALLIFVAAFFIPGLVKRLSKRVSEAGQKSAEQSSAQSAGPRP